MKKAVKIIISGTVQGVFFRGFLKDNAEILGVRGIARNLENGDIEIIAEGDHDKILKFIEVCHQGPKFAQIRNVSVEDKKFSGEFSDFRIIRF